MKSQYFTVVKLLIKNLFLRAKGQKRTDDDKKKLLIYVILGITYLMLAGTMVSSMLAFGAFFVQANIVNEIITIMLGIGAFIVLIYGLVALLSNLYFSNDTEFFLSLPIKPSTVFFAKFTVVYITELALMLLILAPLIITFGAIASLPAFFYLIMIPGILIAPAIPLMLASILAIPLMYVVSFFKQKGALTSIVVIALFGVAFGFYYYFLIRFQSGMISEDVDFDAMLNVFADGVRAFATALYPYLALVRLATLTSFGGFSPAVSALLNFLIFFGSLAALLVVSMFISNAVYKRGAASQLEGRKKDLNVKKDYVSGSALIALLKKEWRELIRTPMFAFQCLSGIVLAPIMVGMFTFGGGLGDVMTLEMEIEAEIGVIIDVAWLAMAMKWFLGFGMMIMMGIGMNIAASSAITREGKYFYISKSIPVDYKTQIKAKVILSTLISLACIFTSLLTLTVATGEFIYPIFGIVFGLIYSYGFNCMSVFLDLRKPKLDWSTPNQAIKQNMNLLIPFFIDMGISIILIIAPIIIAIAFSFVPILASAIIWAIFFIIAILSALIFHNVLYKNVDALYDKLSV